MKKYFYILFKLANFNYWSKGFYNPQSNYKLSFLLYVDHPCLVIFIESLQPYFTPYSLKLNLIQFMTFNKIID